MLGSFITRLKSGATWWESQKRADDVLTAFHHKSHANSWMFRISVGRQFEVSRTGFLCWDCKGVAWNEKGVRRLQYWRTLRRYNFRGLIVDSRYRCPSSWCLRRVRIRCVLIEEAMADGPKNANEEQKNLLATWDHFSIANYSIIINRLSFLPKQFSCLFMFISLFALCAFILCVHWPIACYKFRGISFSVSTLSCSGFQPFSITTCYAINFFPTCRKVSSTKFSIRPCALLSWSFGEGLVLAHWCGFRDVCRTMGPIRWIK